MKRVTRIILMASVGAAAVLGLAGWRGEGGSWCHRGGPSPEQVEKYSALFVDRTLDDIDATDAQRTQIQAVRKDLLKEGMALKDQKRATHEDLLKILEVDKPDAAKLHALVDARIEDLRQLAHEAADSALEVHGTLNPEQRVKLAEKLRERQARWEK